MHKSTFAVVVTCLLLNACSKDTPEPQIDAYDPAHDYFTFANTDQFVVEHLGLDLDVDFDAKELRGSATLRFKRIDPDAHDIVLDTRDLAIEGASISTADGDITAADFRLGETHPIMGTPLIISVPAVLMDASELTVKIDYSTSPESTALQWLPPELTAGGEHPFLFSQSQAIHARSWIPLQDTPSVRITYDARITTPTELLAVMSANNDPDAERDGHYEFEMPQPIPAYLLAIAVGNIYFAPVGEQTGVYTEPEMLEASAYEFADTQAMLETAEDMFGPYQWGRYDLLILPPSFPYGGMENPRLSFLTPSLLAGDRSLVDVVAHELAHSWSGNLVTNATWRDGWLNEGMTSYLEARLMEVIYDSERMNVDNVIAYEELLLDFEEIVPERQALAPPFPDGDPDDFQGIIQYHKGSLFLTYLEKKFSRETFDEFLGDYFDTFAFRTITTEQFLDYLDENLLSRHPGIVSRVQVKQWLYQPGLPDDAILPHSEALDTASAMASSFAAGDLSLDLVPAASWPPKVMVHFINSLPVDLDNEQLAEVDAAFGLSATRNAEIARTWFIQVATRRYEPAYDALEKHLNRFGRTRLVEPVYKALARNGNDRDLAIEMFNRARGNYHPITVAKIEYTFNKSD
jgi:leukotriene-A4 hydrolase